MNFIIDNLTTYEIIAHASILFINLVLFLTVKPVLNHIHPTERDESNKIRIFQLINLLIFTLQAIDILLPTIHKNYEGYFIHFGLSLLSIYCGMLIFFLFTFFSRKRFGHQKELDGKKIYVDSYSTRIVNIIFFSFISFSTVYALIKIWGADSLLETTGIIGIIVAFMAFTSSIWGPDVISGLIILNSEMLEDGDVVIIDGYDDEYIINKVSLIYITLYDVRNNHRSLVRNSRFIQSKIDNLSRIASTEGLRQQLDFNISYPNIETLPIKQREEALIDFTAKIDNMFNTAFEKCQGDETIKINRNSFEWALTQTGNYALTYSLWIYLQRLPNTKLTPKIRRHIIGSRYKVNEAVYHAAIHSGIKLVTPSLNTISINQEGIGNVGNGNGAG